jgi:hypothetical protein
MSAPLPGDKRAGFIGLTVAVVFLLVVNIVIVELTNAKFAGHSRRGPAPAAGAAQH